MSYPTYRCPSHNPRRISTQVVIQISRVKAFRSGKCPLKDVKVILLLSRFFQEGLSNRPMQQGDSAPKHPRTLSRSRHYLPCDGAGIELERTSGEPCTRFQPSLRPCATSDALCTIHEAMFAVSIRKKEAWCGTLHRKGMCQAVGLSKVLEWVVMLRAFTTAAEMRSSGVI